MIQVGSRELKNRLGRYLARVRRGETLVVRHHGEPVAKLVPVPRSAQDEELERKLTQLAAEGHIRRAKGVFNDFAPISLMGKPLSQMIIEDQD